MTRFTNFKSNTKEIWTTINQLFNHCPEKNVTNHMIYNGIKNLKPLEIAQALNKFYIDIAPTLDRNLQQSSENPFSFPCGDYPHFIGVPPIIPHDVISVVNSLKKQKVEC